MNDDGTIKLPDLSAQFAPIFKSSPEKLRRRKEMYDERKQNDQCVECKAELPDGHSGNRCEDCQERRRLSEMIYKRSSRGRSKDRLAKRRQRKARIRAGLCTRCAEPRANWGAPGEGQKPNAKSETCPACRLDMQRINADWRVRKAQGLVMTKEQRREHWKKQRAELRAELRGTNYVPLDELLDKPRVKILRTLQRFDWITKASLLHACGLVFDEGDVESLREWNAHEQALIREVKAGAVERRRLAGMNEHRIAPSGRELLARLLKGSKAA